MTMNSHVNSIDRVKEILQLYHISGSCFVYLKNYEEVFNSYENTFLINEIVKRDATENIVNMRDFSLHTSIF